MLVTFASALHVMSYIQGAQGIARFREAKCVGFFFFFPKVALQEEESETQLKPPLNSKPPQCSHFTIYRWQDTCMIHHVLGLIICTTYLTCWQKTKGTFTYIVTIQIMFNICNWKFFSRLWQKRAKFRCRINRNSWYPHGKRERECFLN